MSRTISLPELPTDDHAGLTAFQREWAARMIDPLDDGSAVEPEVYAHLLYGTVDECLSGIYPYCRLVISDNDTRPERWERLVDDFRRACPNLSPLMLPAVQLFPDYLPSQSDLVQRAPYLIDLAAYEWAEAEIQNALDPAPLPENGSKAPLSPNQLPLWKPFWNHCAVLLALSYDIPALIEQLESVKQDHSIAKLRLSLKPTSALIYRDPLTWATRFFSLTPLTAALLQAAAETASYQVAIDSFIETMPTLQDLPKGTVITQAMAFFNQCQVESILLGNCPVQG